MALAGCSAGVTGVADGVGAVSTFVVGLPSGVPQPVQLFIASTRKGERGTAAITSDGDNVHYSLATISVPPVHQPGSIERPNMGSQDVHYHFVLTGRRPLDDEEAFAGEVASHISGRIGSNRDVLLFVHGFNNSLDEARFRLAQIVVDGKFGGVPVLYTWASRSSVFAYGADRETAMASRDTLERLMLALAHEPGVGRVHILAHSMGAWMAMEALRENAIAGHADLDGHLGEVMLAAPDIDASVFREQMRRIGSSAHVSVLVASGDRALSLSSFLADERPRLGALDLKNPTDRAMIQSLGVTVRDLSSEKVGFIGHATYANAPDVVAAIGAELGAPRADDKGVQAVIDARGTLPVAASPLAPPPSPPSGETTGSTIKAGEDGATPSAFATPSTPTATPKPVVAAPLSAPTAPTVAPVPSSVAPAVSPPPSAVQTN